MQLNDVTNFELFTVAVSDKEGSLSFKKTYTSVAGKLDESGESKVEVIRLSRLVSEGKVPLPDLIKMDIEGAEILVLTDLKELLQLHKPTLFLSTHGEKIHRDCLDLLALIGYRLKPLDSNDLDTSKEVLAYK